MKERREGVQEGRHYGIDRERERERERGRIIHATRCTLPRRFTGVGKRKVAISSIRRADQSSRAGQPLPLPFTAHSISIEGRWAVACYAVGAGRQAGRQAGRGN